MNVIGLIPARAGSKGVPRKNVRVLGGKPLLWYTAQAALASKRLSTVVLSTDDREIAAIGRDYGLHVPFLRPADLATDSTPMLPVVQHAIAALEADNQHIDAVCLLQPTAPFREAGLIDACIDLLVGSGADSVVTMKEVPHEHHPYWVYFPDEQGFFRLSTGQAQPTSRRQDLPPAFHREGSVYVTRRDVVMEGNSLYGERLVGYRIDPEAASVGIDTMADWARAEATVALRSS
jgi:CMP-N-acetylneuraminic acid synthetase